MLAANLLTDVSLSNISIDKLAEIVLHEYYLRYPNSEGIKNPYIRAKSLQDYKYHLLYLSEAVTANRPELYIDYVTWVKLTLSQLGLKNEDIINSFIVLREVIQKLLPSNTKILEDYLNPAIDQLRMSSAELIGQFSENRITSELANEYLQALLRADRKTAGDLIMKQIKEGMKIQDIYLDVFQPALRRVGYLWQMNQVSVAQEHYVTAATQTIMSQIYPYIFATSKNGKLFVGTCVGGELHEVGMRMVADFFEMAGWDTIYLGANTPAEGVVRILLEKKATLLGISATMTFNIHYVRSLIQQVRNESELNDVKIIVGGYPFNVSSELWIEVKADGYARSALEAVSLADCLITT